MRLWRGHSGFDHPVFRRTPKGLNEREEVTFFVEAANEMTADAQAFFKSPKWSLTRVRNRELHHKLQLPKTLPAELIQKYAALVLKIGREHFALLEGTRTIMDAQAMHAELAAKLNAIKTLALESSQLFLKVGPWFPVLLASQSAYGELKESLVALASLASRVDGLVEGPRGESFVVDAQPGYGLEDVGFIVTAWISSFRDTDADLKVHVFALACAWNLLRIGRHGNEHWWSWNSFDRRYQGWKEHPYANATPDIADTDKSVKKFFMSGAADEK